LPTEGNLKVYARMDPVVKRFSHGYAVAHDTTTAQLVRQVLAEWVRVRVGATPEGRVGATLHELELLGMELQLKVAGGGGVYV
jgi:aromatic ring-cleaving dioxygenase